MSRMPIVAAFAAAFLAAAPAGAATAPAAGQYHAVIEIVNVVNSQSQDSCYDVVADYFPNAEVQYGGLSGASIVLWNPINVASDTQPYGTTGVSKQVLTVTAGAGTARPSGTFTWTSSPAEIAAQGRWHADLAYVDAYSFRATLVESYPGPVGGTCTEQGSIAFIKTS